MGMDPRMQPGTKEWDEFMKKREEQARQMAMQKAVQHEQSFNKSQDDDALTKRMGSDLFK